MDPSGGYDEYAFESEASMMLGLIDRVFRTIMFIFIGPGLFTVLLPYGVLSSEMELFSREIGNFKYIGVIPIGLGTAVLLWCAWEVVVFESLSLLAYTVFLGLVCHLWVVYCEEAGLRNRFGAVYA